MDRGFRIYVAFPSEEVVFPPEKGPIGYVEREGGRYRVSKRHELFVQWAGGVERILKENGARFETGSSYSQSFFLENPENIGKMLGELNGFFEKGGMVVVRRVHDERYYHSDECNEFCDKARRWNKYNRERTNLSPIF